MKMAGIVRRIDDLGRIVIPKEIRKNLRLRSGENLEIFIDEKDNIVLRKYNRIDKLKEFGQNIVEAFFNITKNNLFITNNDTFIAAGGRKSEYIGKVISDDLVSLIAARNDIKTEGVIKMTAAENEQGFFAFSPIIANGDAIGSVILLAEEAIKDEELKLLKIISTFLARYIEE